MSCFNLPKKLKQLPSSSKKVWNSFKSSISPKLRTLRNNYNKCSISNTLPRTLSKTATRLFDYKRRRRSIPRPRHPGGGGGGRVRARDFYNSYNQRNDYQHLQPYTSEPNNNSPATVYIDRLFGMSNEEVNKKDVTTATPTTMEEASSSGNTTVQDDNGGGSGRSGKRTKKVRSNKNKDKDKIDKNKWKEYISSMPNIKGVDERAEEFISKFRQDMQIQREQSLIEFQKMLARSA